MTDFREKLLPSKLCSKPGTNYRNTGDILKVCFGQETIAIITTSAVVSKLNNFYGFCSRFSFDTDGRYMQSRYRRDNL
jgi:hypothetical protein